MPNFATVNVNMVDMETTTTNISSCWNAARRLGRGDKIKLIAMLSNSLLHEERPAKVSAKRFYGIWNDGDGVDADALNSMIKEGRKFKDDIEAF